MIFRGVAEAKQMKACVKTPYFQKIPSILGH